MDFLVMLEERSERSPVLAHVNAVPSPLDPEQPSRDVVTLYGEASAEALALALAAAVESRRAAGGGSDAIRHLGIWPESGAVGDAAWRDAASGQLMTRDVTIPLAALAEMAERLLDESGPLIRRLARRATALDGGRQRQRECFRARLPVQRHDVTRRVVGVERRRHRVDVGQHGRAFAVLLEHNEEVHLSSGQ